LLEIDPRLLEDIRGGKCVAFVGAGFSAAAGLPPWPDLVRAVASALAPEEFAEHRATLTQSLGVSGSPPAPMVPITVGSTRSSGQFTAKQTRFIALDSYCATDVCSGSIRHPRTMRSGDACCRKR
jgi:hypothetical protein